VDWKFELIHDIQLFIFLEIGHNKLASTNENGLKNSFSYEIGNILEKTFYYKIEINNLIILEWKQTFLFFKKKLGVTRVFHHPIQSNLVTSLQSFFSNSIKFGPLVFGLGGIK